MTHYRFIERPQFARRLPSKQGCAIGRGIQETLGAMASGGEPPPYRPPTGIDSVYVRTAADTVAVGDTVMFNYELVPPKGQVVPSSATVHWASSDTSVADRRKRMGGWQEGGVASISATADRVRGNAKVTVRPKHNQEDNVPGS